MLNRRSDLEQYCAVVSDTQSAAEIESVISLTQISSVGGTKALNKFQYIDIPLSSSPAFLSFSSGVVADIKFSVTSIQ
jgi:hypothetical protein